MTHIYPTFRARPCGFLTSLWVCELTFDALLGYSIIQGLSLRLHSFLWVMGGLMMSTKALTQGWFIVQSSLEVCMRCHHPKGCLPSYLICIHLISVPTMPHTRHLQEYRMFSSQLYWHFRASMCAAPPHQHWSGTPKLHNSWLVVTRVWIVYREKRRCGIRAAIDLCSVTFPFKTVSCISHSVSRTCKLLQLTSLKKTYIATYSLLL